MPWPSLATLHSTPRERATVVILLTDHPEEFTGDAAVQLQIVAKMGLPIEPAAAFLSAHEPFSGVLYDGVYGTGFRPPSQIDSGH